MELRNIDFGPCLGTSGLQGFWGEGYWFHHLSFINRWYDFSGLTLVGKSTTFDAITDTMPLKNNYQPKELFPKRIWVDFINARALNAVGLAGPGAATVLQIFEDISWKWTESFMLSVVPEGATKDDRLKKFMQFVCVLGMYLRRNRHWRCALQINLSCPNSKVSPVDLVAEAIQYLDIAKDLGIPLIIKINLLVPIPVLRSIAERPCCDALCFSNTIPFGELSDEIDWERMFPKGSPLKEFGGGGLSGEPLLFLVRDYLIHAREAGISKPLITGGGITHPDDVDFLVEGGLRRGYDAIALGSIAMFRPWRIKKTIQRVHALLG